MDNMDQEEQEKVIIYEGEIVNVAYGEYSDYGILGTARAKRDFNINKVLESYLEENPEQREPYCGSEHGFFQFLITKGFIEEMDVVEWHVGSYGCLGEICVLSRA